LSNEEAKRILLDWWGECLTCKYWQNSSGQGVVTPEGLCINSKSVLYNKITWRGGHCEKWDPLAEDAAYEMLEEEYKNDSK